MRWRNGPARSEWGPEYRQAAQPGDVGSFLDGVGGLALFRGNCVEQRTLGRRSQCRGLGDLPMYIPPVSSSFPSESGREIIDSPSSLSARGSPVERRSDLEVFVLQCAA